LQGLLDFNKSSLLLYNLTNTLSSQPQVAKTEVATWPFFVHFLELCLKRKLTVCGETSKLEGQEQCNGGQKAEDADRHKGAVMRNQEELMCSLNPASSSPA
jgi:hypothetical protein